MADLQSMLKSHPDTPLVDVEALDRFLRALADCALHCHICADSCLSEKEVDKMIDCIRTDLNCAAICEVTAQLASRVGAQQKPLLKAQLQACMMACQICATECEAHADMAEHCRICAESCRRCELACQRFLELLG